MRNNKGWVVGLLMGWLVSTAFAASPELELLDAMRKGEGSAKVTTRIEVTKPGEDIRESLLDVYAHEDGRALAVYRSARETGQKVLVLDDQFWLFLPDSKRALRITPMQKLLGEASVGDVSSLAWAEDYRIEARVAEASVNRLTLAAQRKNLSYHTIELTVDATTLHPIKADLYLRSGKFAKEVLFDVAEIDGQWRIVALTLKDKIQTEEVTRIVYDAVTPMAMENKWFNPSYLLRETP